MTDVKNLLGTRPKAQKSAVPAVVSPGPPAKRIGTGKPGPGRPKGSTDLQLRRARAAIANFVEVNADRLLGWLDHVAKDDPKEAFKLVMQVMEYHLPKLQRVETRQDVHVTENKTVTVSELDLWAKRTLGRELPPVIDAQIVQD